MASAATITADARTSVISDGAPAAAVGAVVLVSLALALALALGGRLDAPPGVFPRHDLARMGGSMVAGLISGPL